MLNFEEELKNFTPSLENSEIDDALAKADITDMNDVMFRAFNVQSKNRNNGLINNQ